MAKKSAARPAFKGGILGGIVISINGDGGVFHAPPRARGATSEERRPRSHFGHGIDARAESSIQLNHCKQDVQKTFQP